MMDTQEMEVSDVEEPHMNWTLSVLPLLLLGLATGIQGYLALFTSRGGSLAVPAACGMAIFFIAMLLARLFDKDYGFWLFGWILTALVTSICLIVVPPPVGGSCKYCKTDSSTQSTTTSTPTAAPVEDEVVTPTSTVPVPTTAVTPTKTVPPKPTPTKETITEEPAPPVKPTISVPPPRPPAPPNNGPVGNPPPPQQNGPFTDPPSPPDNQPTITYDENGRPITRLETGPR